MNAIERNIRAWLSRQRTRSTARKKAMLELQARQTLQIREFDGELYYSFRNIPIMLVGDVKVPYDEALEKARAAYVTYMEE